MRHEITMPQLGMSQDTGKVIAWLKSVGEAVDAEETLMEVETDKATMEVPAGRAGVVAEILADVGADVPVGDLIAVISDEAGVAMSMPKPIEDKKASPERVEKEAAGHASDEPEAARIAPIAPESSKNALLLQKSSAFAGRILASPKAKRLAVELGVDFRSLIRKGVSEPIHASDVETAAAASTLSPSLLGAVAASGAFDELCEFLRGSGFDLSASLVWASFVSGALRASGMLDGEIAVSCRDVGSTVQGFVCRNADLAKLSEITADVDGQADIVITNLAETRFSTFVSGQVELPHLVVTAPNEGLLGISLQFSENNIPAASAAGFLEELIERVEHPLRHLL